MIGAIALGGLADNFGRKLIFIGEMIIFVVFLVLLTASPSFPWLIVFLFGIGLALGCDYPTAHLIISESIAEQLARPPGAERLRLPGAGRARRHRRRLCRAAQHPRNRRLALDVCHRHRPRSPGDHRALLRRRKARPGWFPAAASSEAEQTTATPAAAPAALSHAVSS